MSNNVEIPTSKKSLGDKELKMILILGGLIIFFLVYQFVFSSLSNKTDKMKREIEDLRTQISEMEEMKANIDTYESDTVAMQEEIDQIFAEIPCGVEQEDQILQAINLETDYAFEVTDVSLTEEQLLYTMNEAGNNGTDDGKVLMSKGIGVGAKVTYTDLKNALRGLKATNKKMSVDQVSVTYNPEEGNLTGNMYVNMYYLVGGEEEYVPATVEGVVTGTGSIFGAGADVASKVNEEASTEESTEEAEGSTEAVEESTEE